MGDGVPSKRRRKEVDYSALNAQLERENGGGAAEPEETPAGDKEVEGEVEGEDEDGDFGEDGEEDGEDDGDLEMLDEDDE
jgi:hypothetical protein